MAAVKRLPASFWAALLHPWTWRMAWRDSRSQRGRLAIFSLAIVSGIAALTAIHSLKASLQAGVGAQAKALLGADLMVSSRQIIPADALEKLRGLARRSSQGTSFNTMLYFPTADAARLVQVRAFDGEYPFYGKVETEPADAWLRLRTEAGVLLEPALLDQFQAKIGDKVKLGASALRILGVVRKAAPRSDRFGAFAPEAYVRLADLPATGLLGKTSLSSQQLYLELPAGMDAQKVKADLQEDFRAAPWRIETPEDRRENIAKALDSFQQFLGIIALASLVLGAIGVAGAVHAHITRRIPTVAILRCLGCPGQVAFAIYFAQAGVLALFGAVLGAAAGMGLHLGVLATFREKLPVAIDLVPQWLVIAQTTAAGLAVCGGFALLPLLKIRRISPAATLRGSAALEGSASRWQAWPVYILLVALLVALALLNDSNWRRSSSMIGGLAAAFLTLLGVARLLVFLTRRIVRPRWPYLLRQGISNLHRPQNQTVLFLLSLGLGTFLLVTILLAGNLLNKELSPAVTTSGPNIYLVDVQHDQLAGVTAALARQKLPLLESAPMVVMRIASVRGVPVNELATAEKIPKWVARREFRSTYRDHLNATETIVAGAWIPKVSEPNAPVPLSLETDLARDIGVKLGEEITLDVQGVPIRARVTSLRKVDWSHFNLNYFMVFPTGVLEDAPGFYVATTRVPAGTSSGDLQRELVKEFPTVSVIDLSLILELVRNLLGQISQVVSVLAGFTVLAGLPILIGTLLNGRDTRRRESVLLRTLGASARQVQTILVIEYATLGFLSALTGLILAVAANAATAVLLFEASPWPSGKLLLTAFATTTALAIAGGLALSRGVSRHPPLEILRSGA